MEISGKSVTFWMRVKPRSRRQGLAIDAAGELSLSVSAPPEGGRANEACVEFLAGALRVAKRSISIVTGERSRRKLMRVEAENPREVAERLLSLAKGAGDQP